MLAQKADSNPSDSAGAKVFFHADRLFGDDTCRADFHGFLVKLSVVTPPYNALHLRPNASAHVDATDADAGCGYVAESIGWRLSARQGYGEEINLPGVQHGVRAGNFAGKKILVTGATGMVARPLVRTYSKAGKVYAMARYAREEDRRAIEEPGRILNRADLADRETLSAIPEDIDYVINCAVGRSNKFDRDFERTAKVWVF